jgi:hypothetical protein
MTAAGVILALFVLKNQMYMPECREKVSPASAFLPTVSYISPVSAFRYRDQSGTAGHGLVLHLPSYVN